MRKSVVLGDADPTTRLGVRSVCEAAGWVVAAEAASAAAAVEATVRVRPSILLLDVRLPGDGVEVCRTVTREHPATAVVMLAAGADEGDLFRSLRAGAQGFLVKDIDPERLPDALNGVLAGEAALSRHLVGKLIAEFRRTPVMESVAIRSLSARERDVLQALASGATTEEVAAALFVAPVTVRSHAAAAMRKLRVATRDDAFRILRGD